jgi:selenide, water dikinase
MKALCGLDLPEHPDLLVGLKTSDDAGVYRLRDDLAIIQTVDFFTPVVDDPYAFGQIAATNAMSDVYAMGGRPLTSMNIICFPVKTMDISVLQEILRGGLDKIKEAGALLVGGHSVEDDELKYGLSVTGIIHPDDVLTNKGARAGDLLVITKPLGLGIVNTAIKGNMADTGLIKKAVGIMSTLNSSPVEEFKNFHISACTDITGFGLLGHACEMIDGLELGIKLYPDKIPVIPEAIDLARMGLIPAGTYRNRDFRKESLIGFDKLDKVLADILFDPQTSGGLLAAVPGDHAEAFVARLRDKGIEAAAIIGEITEGPAGKISVY